MTAALTFTSNAQSSTTVETLTGTGTAAPVYAINLSWSASTSSNVSGYNIYRAAYASACGSFTNINSLMNTGTLYTDSAVGRRRDVLLCHNRSLYQQGREWGFQRSLQRAGARFLSCPTAEGLNERARRKDFDSRWMSVMAMIIGRPTTEPNGVPFDFRRRPGSRPARQAVFLQLAFAEANRGIGRRSAAEYTAVAIAKILRLSEDAPFSRPRLRLPGATSLEIKRRWNTKL